MPRLMTIPALYTARFGMEWTGKSQKIIVDADSDNQAAMKLIGYGIPAGVAKYFVVSEISDKAATSGQYSGVTKLSTIEKKTGRSLVTQATGAEQGQLRRQLPEDIAPFTSEAKAFEAGFDSTEASDAFTTGQSVPHYAAPGTVDPGGRTYAQPGDVSPPSEDPFTFALTEDTYGDMGNLIPGGVDFSTKADKLSDLAQAILQQDGSLSRAQAEELASQQLAREQEEKSAKLRRQVLGDRAAIGSAEFWANKPPPDFTDPDFVRSLFPQEEALGEDFGDAPTAGTLAPSAFTLGGDALAGADTGLGGGGGQVDTDQIIGMFFVGGRFGEITTEDEAGVETLNPLLAALLDMADLQNGSVSLEQVARIEAESRAAVAAFMSNAEVSAARLRGDSEERVASIRAAGEKAVVDARASSAEAIAGIEMQAAGLVAGTAAGAQKAVAKTAAAGQIGAAQAAAGGQLGAAEAAANAAVTVAESNKAAAVEAAIARGDSAEAVAQITATADAEIATAQFAAQKVIATTQAGGQVGAAQAGAAGQIEAAQTAAGGQATVAGIQSQAQQQVAQIQADVSLDANAKQVLIATIQNNAQQQIAGIQAQGATPFGFVGQGGDLATAQALIQAQTNPFGQSAQDRLALQQAQFNPYDLTNTQGFQLGQAQAATNPYAATQLGQEQSRIDQILRGGLSPEQRLAEVTAGQSGQNQANFLNFIGNPSAVGFATERGLFSPGQGQGASAGSNVLQDISNAEAGNIPGSLFGFNAPTAAGAGGGQTTTVNTDNFNPNLSTTRNWSPEQTGFYQGVQSAGGQTPGEVQASMESFTPQGV